MRRLISLPHRVCESTCYVNGLEDVMAWKGAQLTDYLLSVVGGMAGFSYLKLKLAKPPCMVYWGANPRYLMREMPSWKDRSCFEHLVTYATTPPVLPTSFEHSDGMRFWQARVLKELGEKHAISQWVEASALFERSGKLIIELCKATLELDTKTASDALIQVADVEEEGYGLLKALH